MHLLLQMSPAASKTDADTSWWTIILWYLNVYWAALQRVSRCKLTCFQFTRDKHNIHSGKAAVCFSSTIAPHAVNLNAIRCGLSVSSKNTTIVHLHVSYSLFIDRNKNISFQDEQKSLLKHCVPTQRIRVIWRRTKRRERDVKGTWKNA